MKTVKPYTAMDRAKDSGLHLPESAVKEHELMPSTGIIIELGNSLVTYWYNNDTFEKIKEPNEDFAVGDMIMFSRYAGTTFNIENEDFRILDVKEVMCKLEATEEGKLPYEHV